MTIAAIQGEALIMGRPKGQLLSSFCMAQKLCGYHLFQWLEKKEEEKYCFMTHEKHMRFKFQFL